MPTKNQMKVIAYAVVATIAFKKLYNAFAPNFLKGITGDV